MPAVKQYEALFNQYLPNSTRKQAALGMNSFSAWLLFAQAAKACGGNLTPKCVYDSGPQGDHLGRRRPPGALEPVGRATVASRCMAIVKATSNGLDDGQLAADHHGFNCRSANVVALTGDYGTGVKLQRRRQEHERPALSGR